MATLNVTSIGYTGLYWYISGLSNPFNTTYYREAGMCSGSFSDGTSTRPSGIIDYVTASSSGSSTSTPSTYHEGAWTPGKTYTSRGYTRAANGLYYNAGSKTYTMKIGAPGSLSVDNTYSDALYITWTAPSGGDGVIDYDIRYRVSGGSYQYIYGVSSSRTYYTIPGLNSGTTYYISMMTNGEDTSSSWTSEVSGTTTQTQLPTPTETSYSIGTTTISLTVSSSGATYFWCDYYYYNGSSYIYDGTVGKAGSSSTTFSFTGLRVGTTYEFDIYATASGYSQSNTKKLYHTTQSIPKLSTPTISSISSTTTSVSGYVNSVSGASTYTVSLYRDASPDVLVETKTLGTYGSFTFTGLTMNTGYYIYTKCSGSGYEDSDTSSGYYILTQNVTLTPWEWTYTKTSGGGFNITPTEWLSFYDKIDAVRTAYSLAPYGFNRTASYYQTGQPFYYWMFRHASIAIDDINGQVPDAYKTVNSGDNIYASYFATLRTALNNAISAL